MEAWEMRCPTHEIPMERQERLSSIEGKCGFVDICPECEKERQQRIAVLENRVKELAAKIKPAEFEQGFQRGLALARQVAEMAVEAMETEHKLTISEAASEVRARTSDPIMQRAGERIANYVGTLPGTPCTAHSTRQAKFREDVEKLLAQPKEGE